MRTLRKQHKPPLSQEELALRSDISRSYLSELERGEHDAGLWMLWRLKTALRVTVGHLVREIEAHLPANHK